eukprot:jgi/Galph1/6052/GphlegSOOS_G4746.1
MQAVRYKTTCKEVPCTPCKERKYTSRRMKREYKKDKYIYYKGTQNILEIKTARKSGNSVPLEVDLDEDKLVLKQSNTQEQLLGNTGTNDANYSSNNVTTKTPTKTNFSLYGNPTRTSLESPASIEKPVLSNVLSFDVSAEKKSGVSKDKEGIEVLSRRLSFLSPFRNFYSEQNQKEPTQKKQSGTTQYERSSPYIFNFMDTTTSKSFLISSEASSAVSSFYDASMDSLIGLSQLPISNTNPFLDIETQEKQETTSFSCSKSSETMMESSINSGSQVRQEKDSRSQRVQRCLRFSRYVRDFEEICVLGSGSFGKVYKCRARLDGCLYAVKVISRKFGSYWERQRALKEIYSLAAFSGCPNIIRYFSSWEEDDVLYIQTEYCEQGSVMSLWWEEKQKFDTSTLIDFLFQVLQGLHFLHSRQVVHLDIKPENIYLTKEGLYKIGDFGLVTSISDGRQNLADFSKDICEGDSRYLPLELLHEDYCDLKKADIFSLGLSAYELARSCKAFLPPSGEEWHQIRSGKLKPLTEVPQKLFDLVEKMVSKEPQNRPSSEEALESLIKLSADLKCR